MSCAAPANDDDKLPEPHPLPLTRQWVEDYKRYGTGPKPDTETAAPGVPFERWLKNNPMPDLQELIERAGRRYAASIGEKYIEDPFERAQKAPHQGGYTHITAEEWAEYDRAMADWQRSRRERCP
jgi:hypothetical protein